MQCYFCTNNVKNIDYKDTVTIKKFLDPFARIQKKRHTGICARHQRKLSTAIKQSRFMAFIPYIGY